MLTIAGFDPSSGAGVTADLKVFAAHGLYGLAAITALTVQSTQGVRRFHAINPEFLAETLECLAEDVEISGVKIGMLGTEGIVRVVAEFLAEFRHPPQSHRFRPNHAVQLRSHTPRFAGIGSAPKGAVATGRVGHSEPG